MIDEKKFRKALEFIKELRKAAEENHLGSVRKGYYDMADAHKAEYKAYDAALVVFGELIDD